jgi:hypothetical protein
MGMIKTEILWDLGQRVVEGTHEAPGSSRNFEQGHNISLCAPSCLLQNVRLTFLHLHCVFICLVACLVFWPTYKKSIFIPPCREELRKWFLSMETTLFRYRFRLESPDTQVLPLYLHLIVANEKNNLCLNHCLFHSVPFRGFLWVSFSFHTKHCHTQNSRYAYGHLWNCAEHLDLDASH